MIEKGFLFWGNSLFLSGCIESQLKLGYLGDNYVTTVNNYRALHDSYFHKFSYFVNIISLFLNYIWV